MKKFVVEVRCLRQGHEFSYKQEITGTLANDALAAAMLATSHWQKRYRDISQFTYVEAKELVDVKVYVQCEDDEYRHKEPFADRAMAANWAMYGHICTNNHRIQKLAEPPAGFTNK